MGEFDKRVEQCKKEIEIFKRMITLTKELIELNDNRDKYNVERYLSDFNEQFEQQISYYEKSIKDRLYIIWCNEK